MCSVRKHTTMRYKTYGVIIIIVLLLSFYLADTYLYTLFLKMLTEVEIFVILRRSRTFVENVKRKRDCRNFEAKSKFFFKCWQKSRFSKFWSEIERKFWTEIDFFSKTFDRNRDFRNFYRISNFFRKCWPKSKFSKFYNQNRNLFESVDWNRDFRKFEAKWNFVGNVDRNRDFRNFEAKSKFLENFDRNRFFRNFQPKLKIFRKCWPKSRFSKFCSFRANFSVNIKSQHYCQFLWGIDQLPRSPVKRTCNAQIYACKSTILYYQHDQLISAADNLISNTRVSIM